MARAIIHSQVFNRQLVVVPNTSWGGHEADLLAVDSRNMKLVEIEIKISRADLFADAKKDKWKRYGRMWQHLGQHEWLPRVWKHYYAMPSAMWHGIAGTEAEKRFPATSGILGVYETNRGQPAIALCRRPKCNIKAPPITASEALDIARLAGLRMWDAILK